MTLLPMSIAQAGGAPLEILIWSAVLIGLLLAAWLIVAFVRNRASGWAEQSESSPFSLHQLRRLHREGHLTDEEFERARQRVLEMSGAAPAADRRKDGEEGEDEVDEDDDTPSPPDSPDQPDRSGSDRGPGGGSG